MPKIRKLKRRKTFKVNINRKRLRNKLRKLPDIGCKDIKNAWEHSKSTRSNLKEMGLAYDANQVLKIPNFKKEILSEARLKTLENLPESKEENDEDKLPPKGHVAMNLEAEAKAPRERFFRLPNQQVHFVTYMMDKYGDDYKAMARDKKNYYQMTWRQIRAKINSFKNVPEQYAEYLLKKGEIVLDKEETLEETRKRVAAENVAKYCAPKPKKVKQTSQWLEESINEFDTEDKLEDVDEDSPGKTSSGKKLQLFSDGESDDDKKSKSKSTKSQIKDNFKNGGRDKIKETEKRQKVVDNKSKKAKYLEKMASSDSESEEEFEGSDDEGAGFVDLDDLSEQELSEDDILDDGEFVTDSDEESD
ncbi:uncharacterized protein [Venturia canescens]|uniref:uncharacterized protein n=1 Tax=Venturia canescens TaxID=32260 RepID=UPI001C9C61E5|nr:uncharacterized protein LOC122413070 [Venturia canescens]